MDKIANIYLIIAFSCLVSISSFSQENARFETDDGKVFLNLKGIQKIEIYAKSDSVLDNWRELGNIAASLDSISESDKGSTLHFYKGEKYVWDEIIMDHTPELVQALGVPLSKKGAIHI